MNKNPTRIEAALHVYDAMLGDAEDQVRDILARGGETGAALDRVIARDKRRLARAAERVQRCKTRVPPSVDTPAPVSRPKRVGEWEVAR